MLKVNVAEIRRKSAGEKTFAYELEPQELDLATELTVEGTIRCRGKLSNAGDVLLLQAELSARVQRTCGRCLRQFTALSEGQVVEKFYPETAENLEQDAYVYDSDVLDITEPLRETLLLAEPLQALCKDDCRGLCPACGADLNIKDCGCPRKALDPRLAALKNFLAK